MSVKAKLVSCLVIFIILITSLFYTWAIKIPNTFPIGLTYHLEKGKGLNFLAEDLAEKKIIPSPFWFKVFSVLAVGSRSVVAGDYALAKVESPFSLIKRFSTGDFRLTPIKITIPEGLNNVEISNLFASKFIKITTEDFINQASTSEGYLFPDTYFFLPNVSTEAVISLLKSTFSLKIAPLMGDIQSSKRSLDDIIKMASILEREARTSESRRTIAGILWKRLDLGMPLQVDSFPATYSSKGLPSQSIANPGLDSINDALTPIKTKYLYFLSDPQGNMHYAVTYAEHLQNKQKYLK